MLFYLVLLLINLACMVLASEIAKHKKLNHYAWFLLAALIGPLALLLLYFRKTAA